MIGLIGCNFAYQRTMWHHVGDARDRQTAAVQLAQRERFLAFLVRRMARDENILVLSLAYSGEIWLTKEEMRPTRSSTSSDRTLQQVRGWSARPTSSLDSNGTSINDSRHQTSPLAIAA